MGQFSRALNAVPSSIRMTVSAYMAERINRKLAHNMSRLEKNNLGFSTCFFGQFKLHFVQYII